jgi:hypothetical protein
MLEDRDYRLMERNELNRRMNNRLLRGRRKFVTLICWATPVAIAWPVASRAQRLGTQKRIAILMRTAGS